jgi:hypothetical protein
MSDCRNESGKFVSPQSAKKKKEKEVKSAHAPNGAEATREKHHKENKKHQAKKHRISEMRPSVCERTSLEEQS